MTFRVNDGPLGGKEGKKVTSRQIRDRLLREAEGNVAIKITESNESDAFEVAGRGELQLGVLIETMRREGFELTIGRPRVLTRKNAETGEREEPFEDVLVDVDEPYSGVVVEKMSRRKGVMQDMRPSGGGKVRLTFRMPSRGLIGYHGEFLTDTRGSGIMNRMFAGYRALGRPDGGPPQRQPDQHASPARPSTTRCSTSRSAAPCSSTPATRSMSGLILGEHSRDNDLDVNPIKEKKLTNVRASGKDDAMLLIPPRRMTPGAGDRLHRGRRAGGGHAQRRPPAQALPRPERAEALGAQGGQPGRLIPL